MGLHVDVEIVWPIRQTLRYHSVATVTTVGGTSEHELTIEIVGLDGQTITVEMVEGFTVRADG